MYEKVPTEFKDPDFMFLNFKTLQKQKSFMLGKIIWIYLWIFYASVVW